MTLEPECTEFARCPGQSSQCLHELLMTHVLIHVRSLDTFHPNFVVSGLFWNTEGVHLNTKPRYRPRFAFEFSLNFAVFS